MCVRNTHVCMGYVRIRRKKMKIHQPGKPRHKFIAYALPSEVRVISKMAIPSSIHTQSNQSITGWLEVFTE
jgi:hypothetical protein